MPLSRVFSIIGNFSTLAALAFLAPLPFIQLEPSVVMIKTVYAFYAIGFALVRVSTLVRSQTAVLESGFNDNMANTNFVTGQ